CGVKRRKPGFSLQSFGYAKRISASIPCAPGGREQDIKQALRETRPGFRTTPTKTTANPERDIS
ncbi:MAG: hypothetical protein LBQ57_13200, partial [Spirochaetales bacterium]|nr:hypothetical protein [Spirochaetales bacterium]